MSDDQNDTPEQPLPVPEDVETGTVVVPQSAAVRSRLHGWRLVAGVAALAGAGFGAWVWLFGAWPDRDAAPGARVTFTATAYCKGTTTAAGTAVRRGIAAADREVLPAGSVVSLSTGDPDFDGVYTVLDTGPLVRGHILDLYVWSCHEALAFGRRTVSATILRLGWDPRDSAPSMTDRLLHRKPRKHEPAPDETPQPTSAKPRTSPEESAAADVPADPEAAADTAEDAAPTEPGVGDLLPGGDPVTQKAP